MPHIITRGSPGQREAQGPSKLLIPIVPFGLSLSAFFAIAYVTCIALYVVFPDLVLNHAVLMLFLPGFRLLDWQSFLLGLVESYGYGWTVALVYGPLFNFFSARQR